MELKRVQLSIPAGHDLSGLTFVIRSADSTAWWRDGTLQAYMVYTPVQANGSLYYDFNREHSNANLCLMHSNPQNLLGAFTTI